MSANDDFPLVPMVVAAGVALLSSVWLWSDIRSGAADAGDGIITSAVVARAGAELVRSDPPHLDRPQTVTAHR
jgi:hypothetical protein